MPPKGCIVIKMVRCGKNCGSCPHGPYAYLVTKKDGKQTWKYLGLAKDLKVGKTQEEPEVPSHVPFSEPANRKMHEKM